MLRIFFISTFLGLLAGFVNNATAQDDFLRKAQGRLGGMGGGGGGTGDSIAHRTGLEDSITIRFRFLDTSRMQGFDSALYDFFKVFPTPWLNVHLGNFGTASRSLRFSPLMEPGWDHGFHAYDVYNLTVNETRFFNTTRPYSEINYMLGSKSEQFIRLMHTQNIKPNWNFSFEYRLLNSPGSFQNQNTNHNNYRLTSWYQSKNKRYQNFFILVGNKLQSAENGGIVSPAYLDSTESGYDERSNIPTKLGNNVLGSINPFTTNIGVGTFYTNATYLFRQQYDIGQKDSLVVNDTTVVPLFYPRLRLEHTISYNTYHYRFRDNFTNSSYYDNYYHIKGLPDRSGQNQDTVYLVDYWKSLVNDFSIYTFPDAKNAQQFLKLGASIQTLKGNFDKSSLMKDPSWFHFIQRLRAGGQGYLPQSADEYNFLAHGEYRNKTRNQKWDIDAHGSFYVNGLNAGDYTAHLSLKRLISQQIGYLQLGFENTNRTPSFVFDSLSSFYLDTSRVAPIDLKKENITRLYASYEQPKLLLKLYGTYYLVTNYTYHSGYSKIDQASTLFNVLQVGGEKIFRFGKRKTWNWKTWVLVQQRLGDGPVNLPLLSTRNQFGYDGNLGFKNLKISFGLEGRYFTPYEAPIYSPIIGQFGYQDTATIKLRRPDIAAYVHFRIKSFSAYVRAENLNTIEFAGGGFTRNNIPTLDYPYPGMQIRIGIFWSFVN